MQTDCQFELRRTINAKADVAATRTEREFSANCAAI